jgi:hydrogenase maturation factor
LDLLKFKALVTEIAHPSLLPSIYKIGGYIEGIAMEEIEELEAMEVMEEMELMEAMEEIGRI